MDPFVTNKNFKSKRVFKYSQGPIGLWGPIGNLRAYLFLQQCTSRLLAV